MTSAGASKVRYITDDSFNEPPDEPVWSYPVNQVELERTDAGVLVSFEVVEP